MKKVKNSFIVFLCCLSVIVFFDSCQDDLDEVIPESPIESLDNAVQEPLVDLSQYYPAEEIVLTTIVGEVRTADGDPIQNATVSVAGKIFNTDEKGRFFANNVSVNSLGTTITVVKEGYFKGVRRVYPESGSLEQARIQLIDKTIVGSFSSESGGVVSTTDNLVLSFPAGAIVDGNGNVVSGEVEVAAYWIDPNSEVGIDELPGGFDALNADLEIGTILSSSVAAVELSVNGVEVNLAPGTKAKLEFPIPPNLQSIAPEEIGLWSLEEDLGIWLEEGLAQKQGSTYVAELGHFSFWTCGIGFERVYVVGSVVDVNGAPIPDLRVRATVLPNQASRYAYTNEWGHFSGQLPKDYPLALEFISANCTLLSVEIGSLTETTDLGDFVVSYENLDVFTTSGTVRDCTGAVMPNAHVEIAWPGYRVFVPTAADGTYLYSRVYCVGSNAPDAEVQAYDFAEMHQSELQVVPTVQNVEVGDLMICDQALENYIRITHQDSTRISADFFIAIHDKYVDGDFTGFQFLDLYFLEDDFDNCWCENNFFTGFGQFDPTDNSWNIAEGEDVEEYVMSYALNVDYTTVEPVYAYSCGQACDNDFPTECAETCGDFSFTLLEFNVNPVLDEIYGFYNYSPGDVMHVLISGTTPQGEFLEFEFRKAY